MEIIRLEPILNRASAGLALARRVLDAVHSFGAVTLDFSDVDRMTPSFANAFVMMVRETVSPDQMRERVTMLKRNEQVIQAMEDSAQRFERGLRLSTQRPAMA